jgi:hypothetical protein
MEESISFMDGPGEFYISEGKFEDWFKALAQWPARSYYLCIIYFSLHEDFLIQKYSNYILFYKRFIDDAIYLWRTNGDQTSSLLAFDHFKHDMDQFGLLRWTHLPLSNKVHFLDLTITIDFANKKFLFKTFQNPQNLYLPPNSAHPPGMLKA